MKKGRWQALSEHVFTSSHLWQGASSLRAVADSRHFLRGFLLLKRML
jgi:hypothetical protein